MGIVIFIKYNILKMKLKFMWDIQPTLNKERQGINNVVIMKIIKNSI